MAASCSHAHLPAAAQTLGTVTCGGWVAWRRGRGWHCHAAPASPCLPPLLHRATLCRLYRMYRLYRRARAEVQLRRHRGGAARLWQRLLHHRLIPKVGARVGGWVGGWLAGRVAGRVAGAVLRCSALACGCHPPVPSRLASFHHTEHLPSCLLACFLSGFPPAACCTLPTSMQTASRTRCWPTRMSGGRTATAAARWGRWWVPARLPCLTCAPSPDSLLAGSRSRLPREID